MYSLKASLKALVNLTNIPCLELKKNDFNPKGNMKVKRELFLDESPSSGPSAHPVGEQPEPGRAHTEPARLLCPRSPFHEMHPQTGLWRSWPSSAGAAWSQFGVTPRLQM